MNINYLMKEDWVISEGVPKRYCQIQSLIDEKDLIYVTSKGLKIMEKIKNLQPVFLTEDIVKKYFSLSCINGNDNKNQNVYSLGKCLYLRVCKKGFALAHGSYININNIYEESYLKQIYYVHELQHILKDFEIDKKIKL